MCICTRWNPTWFLDTPFTLWRVVCMQRVIFAHLPVPPSVPAASGCILLSIKKHFNRKSYALWFKTMKNRISKIWKTKFVRFWFKVLATSEIGSLRIQTTIFHCLMLHNNVTMDLQSWTAVYKEIKKRTREINCKTGGEGSRFTETAAAENGEGQATVNQPYLWHKHTHPIRSYTELVPCDSAHSICMIIMILMKIAKLTPDFNKQNHWRRKL